MQARQCELQPLAEYLPQLFQAFADSGIGFCVLRNYSTLPESLSGNDLDILVGPENWSEALSLVASIPGTRIVGFSTRSYALHLCIQGIACGEAVEAMELDIMCALPWKGIAYLDCREILNRRKLLLQHNVPIPVPSPEDEAIISFMSSYLIGGFVKERYQQKVIETFRRSTEVVRERLAASFGPTLAGQVVAAVIQDDRPRLASLLNPLRRELAKRAIVRAPVRTAANAVRHYVCEFQSRYSRKHLTTVALMGVDGSGKTRVIAGLQARLNHMAKKLEFRHLRPRLLYGTKGTQGVVVTDPHAKPPRSGLTSIAKVVAWLAEEWIGQFIGRRQITLRVSDRFYHDLLIDRRRYRYGGPQWLARLVGVLMPEPDLWLLLDAPMEVVRARKQEVSEEETARQLDAYRSFIKTRKHYAILDASRPVDTVISQAHAAIIDTLVWRFRGRLKVSS
jgi:thymidylate kinase